MEERIQEVVNGLWSQAYQEGRGFVQNPRLNTTQAISAIQDIIREEVEQKLRESLHNLEIGMGEYINDFAREELKEKNDVPR